MTTGVVVAVVLGGSAAGTVVASCGDAIGGASQVLASSSCTRLALTAWPSLLSSTRVLTSAAALPAVSTPATVSAVVIDTRFIRPSTV